MLRVAYRDICSGLAMLFLGAVLVFGAAAGSAHAQQAGGVPGAAPGYNIEFWRAVRGGVEGTVSIPDKKAGILVQAEGDTWRSWRNGPVSKYGGWALLGILVLLLAFFFIRGRVWIDAGPGKRRIKRFGTMERFGHWLIASSFIVLAVTGLNMLYGRAVIRPTLGPEVFSALTLAGKYLHTYLAFAFIAGMVVIFVMWVRENLPDRGDLNWILKGGGLFIKGSHPPARKFNFGQKVIFWVVILGGLSVTLSGLSLMFPFQLPMFAKTFAALNIFGLGLPTDLTVLQEMQFAQVWHAVAALALIVIMIAHIYIGTLGMEGAFDAVASGEVDENWAKEHHSLWVAEMKKGGTDAGMAPAE